MSRNSAALSSSGNAGINQPVQSPFAAVTGAVAAVKDLEDRILCLSDRIAGSVPTTKDVTERSPTIFAGMAGDLEGSVAEIHRLIREANHSIDRIVSVLP